MQESPTEVVEVEIVDISTLQRALTYLYTGMYSDENSPLSALMSFKTHSLHSEQYESAKGVDVGKRSPSGVSLSDSGAESESIKDPITSRLEMRAASYRNRDPQDKDLTESQEICQCCTGQENQLTVDCGNERLRANALVYTLADYYRIPDLKQLAVTKFAAGLENICSKGFRGICIFTNRFRQVHSN